jgi:hypothetical protein
MFLVSLNVSLQQNENSKQNNSDNIVSEAFESLLRDYFRQIKT